MKEFLRSVKLVAVRGQWDITALQGIMVFPGNTRSSLFMDIMPYKKL